MKSFTIVAAAVFALVALCSSAPVAVQPPALDQARIDIYNDLLAGLFSGLVSTTFGSISGFLNQLINENPLGVGKREIASDLATRIDIYNDFLAGLFSGLVSTTFGSISGFLNNLIESNPLGVGKRNADEDLAARADALTFLYENVLQQLFSGLVTNTFGTITSTLNNLIQTNPLGVGKRDAEEDLAARADALTFLYENVLQQLFSGLVTNTFGTITSTLNNLIQTNPLGVGKRDAEEDLAARADALTFLYENVLQQLFSGLVTNTFGTITSTLNNLIQTNPLGVGKRALAVNPLQFLYDNVLSGMFGGLATNTASYLQNALNDLLNKPFNNGGKRSVNIQQAQAVIAQAISALVAKYQAFAQQALASLTNVQQLAQLVKDNIAFIKATVTQLAQQLSQLIPAAITTEVSQVLGLLQASLIYWTSGLGSSLGPVIGPFRP